MKLTEPLGTVHEDDGRGHIDHFINFGSKTLGEWSEMEIYARWVINHFRLPAVTMNALWSIMRNHKLFCTYEGVKYRVIGASRLGDLWLAKDFTKEVGYDKRVDWRKCSNWSKE